MGLRIYALSISCFLTFITMVFSSEIYRCPAAAKSRGEGTCKTFKGKCYQFIGKKVTWTAAREYCRSNGARLLEIRDAATQKWIYFVLTNLDPMRGWHQTWMWLGGHDRHTEGKYEWSSDAKLIKNGYSNWAYGEPSYGGDCVTFWISKNGEWMVEHCGNSLLFIYKYIFTCEYDMLPLTATTTTTTTATTASTTTSTRPTSTVIDVVTSVLITKKSEGNTSIIITLPPRATYSTQKGHLPGEGVVSGRQTTENDKALSEGELAGLVVSILIVLVIIVSLIGFLVRRWWPTCVTRPTASDNLAMRQDNFIKGKTTGDSTRSQLEVEDVYEVIGEGTAYYIDCKSATSPYGRSPESIHGEPEAMKLYNHLKERNSRQDNAYERHSWTTEGSNKLFDSTHC